MLTFVRDPKFFQGSFVPSTGSTPLKRIYLRIMDYVQEVLLEDWSEIPPPDFSKAIVGSVEELNRFLLLVVLTLTSRATLRIELEGLLGSLKGDSDRIKKDLQIVPAIRSGLAYMCRCIDCAARPKNVHVTTV